MYKYCYIQNQNQTMLHVLWLDYRAHADIGFIEK